MKLQFLRQVPETDTITTFAFLPQEPLAWTAGQSIRLELPRASYGGRGAALYHLVCAVRG